MSKLRVLPTMIMLALLSGCGQKFVPAGGGGGSMDSPIVVSDDLHVRHAHQKGGAKPDFQIQPGGQVTASSDSGNEIKTIKCENMDIKSHSGSYPDCTSSGFDVSGGKQWQIDIYASMDGSGPSLTTLTPKSPSPPCSSAATYCQVIVNPDANVLADTQDDGSDPDTKGGTDLAVYDASSNPLNFASAKLTDTSTSNYAIMSCKNLSPHDCHIRIKYH